MRDLQAKLNHASSDAVDEDRALQWASSKLLFFLSEDTNTHELNWGLRELERQWEALRDEHDTKLKDTIRNEEGRSWWRFGL